MRGDAGNSETGSLFRRLSAECPAKRLRPPCGRRQVPHMPLALEPPCALLRSNLIFSQRGQFGAPFAAMSRNSSKRLSRKTAEKLLGQLGPP